MSEDTKKGLGTWAWIALLALLVYSQYAGKGGCAIAPILQPAPIAVNGLHVVEFFDSKYLRDMTKERLAAHNSNAVPEYIESKGGKFDRVEITTERDGIDPVWLPLLDKWKSKMEGTADEHFVVVVSNAPNRGGTEQPLPNTPDEWLALVKKFAE